MPYYVGKGKDRDELLYDVSTPTEKSYGGKYFAVVGPFRTLRAATWAVKHGKNNPHFQHVNDAEKISKISYNRP